MALQNVAKRTTRTTIGLMGASLFALAAILAGCMAEQPPGQPGLSQRHAAFHFNDDAERASLAYGVDGTDDLDLMLECQPGSRLVEITDAAHGGARSGQALTLISGATKASLAARVERNEENGQDLAVARAPSDHPALMGFRRTGKLGVALDGRALNLTASAGDQVQVARFFSVCERRP